MKIMLPMSLCALYLVCSVHRYRAPHLLNSRTPTRLGTSAVIQPDTGTIQAKQQKLTKASIHLHRSSKRRISIALYTEALAQLLIRMDAWAAHQ